MGLPERQTEAVMGGEHQVLSLHPLTEKLISGKLERLQGTRISTQTDQALFLWWLPPCYSKVCPQVQTSVT